MFFSSQLQQSEAARETEMTDLDDLTEEFTQRISSMERKLQASQKVSIIPLRHLFNTSTKLVQYSLLTHKNRLLRATRGQFHRAAKHKNLLSMKFLP